MSGEQELLDTETRRARSRERRELAWPAFTDAAATYDALGRKQPHRMGFVQLARAIPGFTNQFAGRVPAEFIATVDSDTVEIACPCGRTPRVTLWGLTECDCGRFFTYTGRDVRVARPDREPDNAIVD